MPLTGRISILLGAVLLGVGVGAAIHARRTTGARPLAFVEEDEAELDAVAAELAREVAAAQATGRAREGLVRVPLDEELVKKLMPMVERNREWDPHSYFRATPNWTTQRDFPEYPGGSFPIRTNSLGLHMDAEPASTPPDLRVLLVGDSHLTGVCANADCAAGRLEEYLATADPSRSVEVINGSQGAYTFYHYLGVLERMIALDLTPDVFVVVVYGGNDFLGVYLWHFFTGTPRVTPTKEQVVRRQEVSAKYGPAMGQILNAAEYFARGGADEAANALAMADQATGEIASLCDEHGIELVVAYLPFPGEVPGTADLTTVQAGLEILELGEPELAGVASIADAYVAATRARGVTLLDLREPFAAAHAELYWRLDLHLNLAGHELTARTLVPAVEAAWSRLQARR